MAECYSLVTSVSIIFNYNLHFIICIISQFLNDKLLVHLLNNQLIFLNKPEMPHWRTRTYYSSPDCRGPYSQEDSIDWASCLPAGTTNEGHPSMNHHYLLHYLCLYFLQKHGSTHRIYSLKAWRGEQREYSFGKETLISPHPPVVNLITWI